MIEIVLAGRPMGKQRVKRGAAGNAYTPERTVTFESRLAYEAQHVMAGRPLLEGPIAVELVVVVPVPTGRPRRWHAALAAGEVLPTVKPDFDNYAKMLDGLNLMVWRDDAQIVRGEVIKAYGDKPMFAVRVTELERQPPLPAWMAKHMADAALFD